MIIDLLTGITNEEYQLKLDNISERGNDAIRLFLMTNKSDNIKIDLIKKIDLFKLNVVDFGLIFSVLLQYKQYKLIDTYISILYIDLNKDLEHNIRYIENLFNITTFRNENEKIFIKKIFRIK